MDVSQYLDIFIDETKEHLQNLNTHILELEQDGENMDTINEIFRAAHSLKGMAGTMGYKRMQTLTHDMENVFSEVRNGNIKVDSDMIDLLFKCLDALEEYLSTIKETADEVSFFVDGTTQTQITLELEPNKEYKVVVGQADLGVSKTDVGGKLTFDVELSEGSLVQVKITAA